MPYQIPKKDHPWRRYKDRVVEIQEVKVRYIKPLKILITEFAESWDSITVVTTALGREGEFKLSELSQSKQAAWLAGILKRNYA
jgi:hypothetical protein